MSFRSIEVLEEFASATSLGREWLEEGDGYLPNRLRNEPATVDLGNRSKIARARESSRRWARLKERDGDAAITANRARVSGWRKTAKADPAKAEALRARQAKWAREKRARLRDSR